MSDTFTRTVGGSYNPLISNHCQYVFGVPLRKYSFSLGFLISCLHQESVIHLKWKIFGKCFTLIFYEEETFIIIFCDQHLSCSACI